MRYNYIKYLFFIACLFSCNKNYQINKYKELLLGKWGEDFEDLTYILTDKDKKHLETQYKYMYVEYFPNGTFKDIDTTHTEEGKWDITFNKKEKLTILNKKYTTINKSYCYLIKTISDSNMVLGFCNNSGHARLKRIK